MEIELKLTYPSSEALYDTVSSAWFLDMIKILDQKEEDYISCYFDTTDLSLHQVRTTARVRHVAGGQYIHTVKCGGNMVEGLASHYEWNLSCGKDMFSCDYFIRNIDQDSDPSEYLLSALAPAKDQPLMEIFRTQFKRKTITASFRNSVVEICLDEGACLAGSKSLPICEMEIELVSGNSDDIVELGEAVKAHSPAVPSTISKFGRCMKLLSENEEQ